MKADVQDGHVLARKGHIVVVLLIRAQQTQIIPTIADITQTRTGNMLVFATKKITVDVC